MNKEMQYNLGSAGRVKSAGVSFEPLISAVRSFDAHTSAKTAMETTELFRTLRKNPPVEIRNRFFPDERAVVRGMTQSSPALLRPILKTDQGQGCFLPFSFGGEDRLDFKRQQELPYFIPEAYFQSQFHERGKPVVVAEALNDLDRIFASGDYDEARLAYERLELACDANGMHLKREADVGRDGLFFIRPAIANHPIRLPQHVAQAISEEVELHARVFTESMEGYRRLIARKYDVTIDHEPFDPPLYFQADFQVFPDGKVMLDQVQLPDVGLFLTNINARGNVAVEGVQRQMNPVKQAVIERIADEMSVRKKKILHLITRDDVLNHQEDVLEQLEMDELTVSFKPYGIQTVMETIQDARALSPDDVALILNIDRKSRAFQELLVDRITKPTATMFPDPLVIEGMNGFSGYETQRLAPEMITNIKSIIGEPQSTPEGVYRQIMAFDHLLDKAGITGYVFHVHIPGQATPVPCLRHDIRSFQIAFKDVRETDDVYIRSVPIDSERAVLFDENHQPLYAVFRVMAIRSRI